MSTLLHVDSSHSDHSVSRRLTALFAAAWRRTHPGGGYRYRDLAADPVPLIGPAYVRLGERAERNGSVSLDAVTTMIRDDAERDEWERTLPLVTEVRAAPTVLIGAPMYNFGIAASLKAWIDRIRFPGALARAEGERPPAGTRFVVVATRGGAYGPGTPREPFDFQVPYLRAVLGEMGGREIHVVTAEMTRAADIPALARFRHLTEPSEAAARTELLRLATVGDRVDAG